MLRISAEWCKYVIGESSYPSFKKRGRAWLWEIKSRKINARKRGAVADPISQESETLFRWLAFEKKKHTHTAGRSKLTSQPRVGYKISEKVSAVMKGASKPSTLLFNDRLFYSFELTFSRGTSRGGMVICRELLIRNAENMSAIEARNEIPGKRRHTYGLTMRLLEVFRSCLGCPKPYENSLSNQQTSCSVSPHFRGRLVQESVNIRGAWDIRHYFPNAERSPLVLGSEI